jgi:hypothetical protein
MQAGLFTAEAGLFLQDHGKTDLLLGNGGEFLPGGRSCCL